MREKMAMWYTEGTWKDMQPRKYTEKELFERVKGYTKKKRKVCFKTTRGRLKRLCKQREKMKTTKAMHKENWGWEKKAFIWMEREQKYPT